MAEAVLGLVPYIENKVVLGANTFRRQTEYVRRAQEYKQLQRWTSSTLRISTVFDWGHTCDLAEALDHAANVEMGTEAVCWAFTSRTLLSKATGKEIEPEKWARILNCFVSRDVVKERNGSHIGDAVLRLVGKDFDPLKARFMEMWIRLDDDVNALEGVMSGDSDDHYYDDGREVEPWDIREFVSDKARELDTVVQRLHQETKFVINILEDACTLFHRKATLHRCCDRDQSIRRRALRKNQCEGVQLRAAADRCGCESQAVSCLLTEERWEEFRTEWLRFIESWDAIVANAAKTFSFPWTPGLDDLIFHDMVTGYVASSRMLRQGARYTSENGTTIVHPGERAAVVSSRSKIVSFRRSALDVHGINRDWNDAAVEFANYALLRCDLVCRSRMTFSDALRDWESQYTSWDRAPATLSDWKDSLGEGEAADDYRLVLMRQALGTEHSIEVFAARGTECSVLGGFVLQEHDRSTKEANGNVLIINRPLTLKAYVHTPTIDKDDGEALMDRWGVKGTASAGEDGWYKKIIVPSGRPGIVGLQLETLNGQERKEKGQQRSLSVA